MWARSSAEKAEVFAKYLDSVFMPNPDEFSLTTRDIMKTPSPTDIQETNIEKCTEDEVFSILKKLKQHKAPGYDLISAKVLRELPPVGIIFLSQLYNAILKRRYVPPQWKVAQITMILKPGKSPDDVKSYRPISLLPIPSEILELLILKLMPIIERHHLIPDHQFGFRHKHGTIEQVHRLVDKINTTFEQKKFCSAVFLDISQAFDRVWYDGLLHKINSMMPTNFYTFIKSYLSDRHFFVKQER